MNISRLRCESRAGVLKKGDVAAPPRERLNLKHEALRILWINPHSILNDVSAEDFILLVLILNECHQATPPFQGNSCGNLTARLHAAYTYNIKKVRRLQPTDFKCLPNQDNVFKPFPLQEMS